MVQIREYQPGDEDQFVQLDRELETHPWNRRSVENWRWKYRGNNPAGEAINIIAEHDNEMVAHFAVIPMRYWINQKPVLGSHSIAMMVKPEWQKRGLIKFVADKVLEETEKRDIHFTYGYPNDLAHGLHIQHLGYEDWMPQQFWHKQLSTAPNVASEGLECKPIEKFDQSVDQLWERTCHQYQAIVKRDAAFLNWRYLECPDIKYHALGVYQDQQLLGYAILKIYVEGDTRRGHIIDLYTDLTQPNIAKLLLAESERFFIAEKVTEIVMWAQPSSKLTDMLADSGYEQKGTRPLICRINDKSDATKASLAPNDWHLMMGDSLEIY